MLVELYLKYYAKWVHYKGFIMIFNMQYHQDGHSAQRAVCIVDCRFCIVNIKCYSSIDCEMLDSKNIELLKA